MKSNFSRSSLKPFVARLATAAALAAVIALGLALTPQTGRANHDDDDEDVRIQIGYRVAPVPLNLRGRNRELVGLGSYIMNAASDCNSCHTMNPGVEFSANHNPHLLGQLPAQVNPKVYLGGGEDFGALDPQGLSAHIITRNLTPDKTGRPEGGATFAEFVNRVRNGVDEDHWHPTCSGALNAHCVPAPFDGTRLQIMPWPTYSKMSDHDLRAMYEYLSAIPCLEGDPGNPDGADTHGTRCR
jgi:cytochrome c553